MTGKRLRMTDYNKETVVSGKRPTQDGFVWACVRHLRIHTTQTVTDNVGPCCRPHLFSRTHMVVIKIGFELEI